MSQVTIAAFVDELEKISRWSGFDRAMSKVPYEKTFDIASKMTRKNYDVMQKALGEAKGLPQDQARALVRKALGKKMQGEYVAQQLRGGIGGSRHSPPHIHEDVLSGLKSLKKPSSMDRQDFQRLTQDLGGMHSYSG